MSQKLICLVVAVGLPLAVPARSQDAAPRPLLINGKPIDPLCLLPAADQTGETNRIDLTKCRSEEILVREANPKAGLIGFSYVDKKFPDQTPGSFYYRYVGQYGGKAILYTEYSGGGTGYFPSVIGLKNRGKNSFEFNTIATGDRCNGSVSRARVEDHHLFYDQRQTPSTMMDLGRAPLGPAFAGYLDYSAVSCVATAHMRDSQLMSVTLDGGVRPADKALAVTDESAKPRACFDEVFRQFDERHETELDRHKLDNFRAQFDICMARK